MKVTFTLPATIDLTAAGIERSVDPSEFAANALEGIFTYGVRRWFQDHLNAAAHTFKRAAAEAEAKGETFNGGKPFDAAAAFAARLDAAKTGELSARSTGPAAPRFTALETAIYGLAASPAMRKRHAALADAWARSKGLATAERTAAILSAFTAMPEADRKPIETAAAVTAALMEGDAIPT